MDEKSTFVDQVVLTFYCRSLLFMQSQKSMDRQLTNYSWQKLLVQKASKAKPQIDLRLLIGQEARASEQVQQLWMCLRL